MLENHLWSNQHLLMARLSPFIAELQERRCGEIKNHDYQGQMPVSKGRGSGAG